MEELQIHKLACRYFAHEASDDEKQALDQWLDESEENRTLFAEYKTVWKGAKPPKAELVPEFSDFWERLSRDLMLEARPPGARDLWQSAWRSCERLWPRKFAVPILVFSALFVFTVALVSWLKLSDDEIRFVICGPEREEIDLPDGSIVTLDAASEIAYSKHFAPALRIVNLKGHAYFDITKDKSKRPFFVQTEHSLLRVHGTEFDVDTKGQQTRVIVTEGQLILQGEVQGRPAVTVRAGELASCKAGQGPGSVVKVEPGRYLSWLSNSIEFYDASLVNVISKLGKEYDVDIRLGDSNLANVRLSGNFRKMSIVSTLDAVCGVLNLDYRSDGGIYLILPKEVAAVQQ